MLKNFAETMGLSTAHKEELIQVFPNSKVFFDLDLNSRLDQSRTRAQHPLLVTIKDKEQYCFVKCEEFTLKEIFDRCKLQNENNIDRHGGWSDNEIEIFIKNLETMYGKEMAKCLLNLSIDARLKFNTHHMSNGLSERIMCCIFCEKEQEGKLKKALQISMDYFNKSGQKRNKENYREHKFGKDIEELKTKHYSIFKMDLILLYDLLNYFLIAFRSGMLDKNGHILDITK